MTLDDLKRRYSVGTCAADGDHGQPDGFRVVVALPGAGLDQSCLVVGTRRHATRRHASGHAAAVQRALDHLRTSDIQI